MSDVISEKSAKVIMMVYSNTKDSFRSLHGDTEYCDIKACMVQRGTLAPYLFIDILDYDSRTMSRRHLAENITDAGFAFLTVLCGKNRRCRDTTA